MNDVGEDDLLTLKASKREGFFEFKAFQQTGKTQYGVYQMPARNGTMVVALGYRRYKDCDKTDTPGQDYVVLRFDERHVVGVLADGVGQSFYGNLAAEHVSSWLIENLWRLRSAPPAETQLEEGLKAAEQTFAVTLESVSLDHLSDMHRGALDATRRSGSQAVFAAFIWDFIDRTGVLYQVGDAVAVVFRDDEHKTVDAPAKGRWSSAGKSQLMLQLRRLDGASGVLLKSDGADPAWGADVNYLVPRTDEFARMASVRSESDDVSFVSCSLLTGTMPAVPVQPEVQPPAAPIKPPVPRQTLPQTGVPGPSLPDPVPESWPSPQENRSMPPTGLPAPKPANMHGGKASRRVDPLTCALSFLVGMVIGAILTLLFLDTRNQAPRPSENASKPPLGEIIGGPHKRESPGNPHAHENSGNAPHRETPAVESAASAPVPVSSAGPVLSSKVIGSNVLTAAQKKVLNAHPGRVLLRIHQEGLQIAAVTAVVSGAASASCQSSNDGDGWLVYCDGLTHDGLESIDLQITTKLSEPPVSFPVQVQPGKFCYEVEVRVGGK